MKTTITLLILAALPLTAGTLYAASAADVSGTWTAEFDTQRGLQKYTFTLKQNGAAVTGKASVDTGGEKRESDLKEGKIEGDTLTFVEPLSIQGNDIQVTFTGKLVVTGSGANEIKFTRKSAISAVRRPRPSCRRQAPRPSPPQPKPPRPSPLRPNLLQGMLGRVAVREAGDEADSAAPSNWARTTNRPSPIRPPGSMPAAPMRLTAN